MTPNTTHKNLPYNKQESVWVLELTSTKIVLAIHEVIWIWIDKYFKTVWTTGIKWVKYKSLSKLEKKPAIVETTRKKKSYRSKTVRLHYCNKKYYIWPDIKRLHSYMWMILRLNKQNACRYGINLYSNLITKYLGNFTSTTTLWCYMNEVESIQIYS